MKKYKPTYCQKCGKELTKYKQYKEFYYCSDCYLLVKNNN